MDFLSPLQVLWDYLCLHQTPAPADCIVGFGNFNDNIARRAAQLYHQGLAPKVLFTGGVGRNTDGLFTQPEAVRFAAVAMACGVPERDILLEPRSTNTRENIEFTRQTLQAAALPCQRLLGVHQPFMERRITAAMGVYWPEVTFSVTSPEGSLEDYLAQAQQQGLTQQAAVAVIVGDFQRIDLYARLGYQLPQTIPPAAWEAFHTLVSLGYDSQLAADPVRP